MIEIYEPEGGEWIVLDAQADHDLPDDVEVQDSDEAATVHRSSTAWPTPNCPPRAAGFIDRACGPGAGFVFAWSRMTVLQTGSIAMLAFVQVVERMLSLACVRRGDTVYDLGSGDGRLVIAAARLGARAVGVDLDPERVAEARSNARRAGVDAGVQFRQGDLFQIDLSPATVLTLYLLPDVNLKLRPRILRELRPGARVASHDFAMADWKPDASEIVGQHTVCLWVVPARVEGGWRWRGADPERPRPYLLELGQKFQEVTGSVTVPGRPGEGARPAMADLELAGDRLAFTLTERVEGREVRTRYQGRVEGGQLVGTARQVAPGGEPTEWPWQAARDREP